MRNLSKKIMAGLLLFFSCPIEGQNAALADNATATMNVSLTIEKGCSFSFNTDGKTPQNGQMDFGKTLNLAKDLPAETDLFVACTTGYDIPITIAMDAGQHPGSGGYKSRNLATTGADGKIYLIPYHIFKDSQTNGTEWGSQGSPDVLKIKYSSTQGDKALRVPIYGFIPAQPNNSFYPGSYSDKLTLTLTMDAQ